MKTILIIFFLTIQSSYINNSEIPATAAKEDTVQFYAAGADQYRIKTFATDEDAHIYSLGAGGDILTLARTNTNKHYGDVLRSEVVIETTGGVDGLRKELAKRGLGTQLEVAPSGAVFWAPKGSRYRTKSSPQ